MYRVGTLLIHADAMEKELKRAEVLKEQSMWEGFANIKYSSFVHYFFGQPSKGWLCVVNRCVIFSVQKREASTMGQTISIGLYPSS